MSRKRRGRINAVNGSTPHPPLSTPKSPAPPQPVTVRTNRSMHIPPHLSDAFKGIVERAAERAKNDLASTGKIRPAAFFVYADGTMKVVSLSFKGQLQKDGLIRRIREKALAENASEVLVLTEAEHERHVITVLSGTTLGMSASARLDYSFNKETKTVTSWKMIWLDKHVQNVFLDGIFNKTG